MVLVDTEVDLNARQFLAVIVTGHFTELLSYQTESYRIRGIGYLPNINESYRIIM